MNQMGGNNIFSYHTIRPDVVFSVPKIVWSEKKNVRHDVPAL